MITVILDRIPLVSGEFQKVPIGPGWDLGLKPSETFRKCLSVSNSILVELHHQI